MPRALDYHAARSRLELDIRRGRDRFGNWAISTVPVDIARATEQLMRSATQAYRDVLVGCCLARILDPQIDIHLPYASQGNNAYNGRTLDETVVNPFLQSHEVPASRGPFLSVFRRSVSFGPDTRAGVQDKIGLDALLGFIDALSLADATTAEAYLRHLLVAFVRLRDASDIALLHVQRLSLEQLRETPCAVGTGSQWRMLSGSSDRRHVPDDQRGIQIGLGDQLARHQCRGSRLRGSWRYYDKLRGQRDPHRRGGGSTDRSGPR